MKVRITFTDPILGSTPNNRDLYVDYKAANAPTPEMAQEEIEAIPVIEQEDGTIIEALAPDSKGITIFPRDINGNPFMWDFQIKGFFKEKCAFLKKVPGTKSSGVKAHKKMIDGNIFIKDRVNLFVLPDTMLNEDGEEVPAEITLCQRSLRAETAQGPRVALACSEAIPEGSYVEFTVISQVKEGLDLVREWLEDGVLHGTGQWRNSGKGRFVTQFGKVKECSIEEIIAAKRAAVSVTSDVLEDDED